LVALGLRLAHLAAVVGFELRTATPGLDRWLAMQIATTVADGHPFGEPWVVYDSSPLYAVALGAAYRLARRRWLVVLIAQAALGALVPLCFFGAGRRLGSARVGVLAALLAAFYGPAIFHEALTTRFALVPFVTSALLCSAASAARGAWPAALAAGATGAALVNLRANAVTVLPVVAAWLTCPRAARAARTTLAFGAGLLAVAAPVAAWRGAAAARGVTSSFWGIHFYVGTQPQGDGGYLPIAGVADDVFGHVDDARAVAEANVGHDLSPGEVSRFWFRRGLALIRAQPLDYLALEGRKLRRLLAPEEEDSFGDDYGQYAARSWVLGGGSLTFGAIAPLALLGLVVGSWERADILWCAAAAGAYALSLLLFFVTGRYRLPFVMPALLLAAFGLRWLSDAWRARRWAALLGTSAFLWAVAAALGAPRADFVRLGMALAVGLPLSLALRPDGAPPEPVN
jgi:hypothetical protein